MRRATAAARRSRARRERLPRRRFLGLLGVDPLAQRVEPRDLAGQREQPGAQRRVDFPHQRRGAQPFDGRRIAVAVDVPGCARDAGSRPAAEPVRRGSRRGRAGSRRRRCGAGRFRAGSRQPPARLPVSGAPRQSPPGAKRRAARQAKPARSQPPTRRRRLPEFPEPAPAPAAPRLSPRTEPARSIRFPASPCSEARAAAGASHPRTTPRLKPRTAPEPEQHSAPPRLQPATPRRRRSDRREPPAGQPHSAARL